MPSGLEHLDVIHLGRDGERIRRFQAAARIRLTKRGLARYAPEVDGVAGPQTIEAAAKCAWALGAKRATMDRIRSRGEIPVQVQRMVRRPGDCRTAQQVALGKRRVAKLRDEKAAAAKRREQQGGRGRAVNAAMARVGTVEHPAGSNGGPLIDDWQRFYGFGHVAWCGIFAGFHLERYGGVNLDSRVASVAAIEDLARAGSGPYVKWTSSTAGALPGSLVVIGGRGVHVGILRQPKPDGGALTVEGNTSFGPGGSQSNGGCVAARDRSDGEVYGVAHLDFPLAA